MSTKSQTRRQPRGSTHAAALEAKKKAGDIAPAVSERTHQEWVPLATLLIDRRYQRPVNLRRVTKMAATFDPDALGTLTVSRRDDGTNYVLDGQHRVEALRAMGWGDQLAPALVYTGLTLIEEARIFRLMNVESVAPKAFDIFSARIAEGDPDVKAMLDVVTALGLDLDKAPGPGHIAAVAAVEKVFYSAGPTTLLYALRTIRDSWKDVDAYKQSVFAAQIIVALGVVYSRYGRFVDQRRMIQVLGRTWDPATLLRDGRAAAKSMRAGNISFTILPHLIVAAYNKRIDQSRHLPTWEFREHSNQQWAPIHGAWETDTTKRVLK